VSSENRDAGANTVIPVDIGAWAHEVLEVASVLEVALAILEVLDVMEVLDEIEVLVVESTQLVGVGGIAPSRRAVAIPGVPGIPGDVHLDRA